MPFTFLALWQMSPVELQYEFGRWCASAARGNESSTRVAISVRVTIRRIPAPVWLE